MAQRPITTVTHFSTHGLREVVGRAVHDQREYSAYERLVSAGPKRAPSTLGNHEIPVRHECVADCALAAQSRLRTSPHPTARPRPSSRWSAFLRCFTPEKQRRPALRCPARGAVALRPSSGQRISPEPAFVLPAISPGRANRASNHRRCWSCSHLGFPSGAGPQAIPRRSSSRIRISPSRGCTIAATRASEGRTRRRCSRL